MRMDRRLKAKRFRPRTCDIWQSGAKAQAAVSAAGNLGFYRAFYALKRLPAGAMPAYSLGEQWKNALKAL